MTLTRIVAGFAIAVLGCTSHSYAQLVAAKDAPIVFGHLHIATPDVEAQKKFWLTLGGSAMKFPDNEDLVTFGNVLVFAFFREQTTGGTSGTTVDHVGLSVTNLREVVDRVKSSGFKVITRSEVPAPQAVVDDIARIDERVSLAVVLGPDDLKVELLERHERNMKPQPMPVVMDQVHFFGPQKEEMRDWYVRVFGATPRTTEDPGLLEADLPGVRLLFSASQAPVAGTRGRALDQIGFEVHNLEAFAKKLEDMGIKMTRPYHIVPKLGYATAYVTDPWGTYIQLSEGMGKVQLTEATDKVQ